MPRFELLRRRRLARSGDFATRSVLNAGSPLAWREGQGARSFPSRNFAVNVAAEAGAMPMVRDALVILNFRQLGCGFAALVAEERG